MPFYDPEEIEAREMPGRKREMVQYVSLSAEVVEKLFLEKIYVTIQRSLN